MVVDTAAVVDLAVVVASMGTVDIASYRTEVDMTQ